jgi:hypothetical protein
VLGEGPGFEPGGSGTLGSLVGQTRDPCVTVALLANGYRGPPTGESVQGQPHASSAKAGMHPSVPWLRA